MRVEPLQQALDGPVDQVVLGHILHVIALHQIKHLAETLQGFEFAGSFLGGFFFGLRRGGGLGCGQAAQSQKQCKNAGTDKNAHKKASAALRMPGFPERVRGSGVRADARAAAVDVGITAPKALMAAKRHADTDSFQAKMQCRGQRAGGGAAVPARKGYAHRIHTARRLANGCRFRGTRAA